MAVNVRNNCSCEIIFCHFWIFSARPGIIVQGLSERQPHNFDQNQLTFGDGIMTAITRNLPRFIRDSGVAIIGTVALLFLPSRWLG